MSRHNKQPRSPAEASEDGVRENVGTYLLPDHYRLDNSAMLRESYETALERMEGRVDEPDSDVLLILAHKADSTALQQGLKLTGMLNSLVVGRHSMTPYRVEGDTNLSLRHALVILSRDSHDCPVVRAIDLHSSSGIFTADQRMHHSIASNGPLALRTGDSGLFVLFPDQFKSGRLPAFEEVPWTQVAERSRPYSVEEELQYVSQVSKSAASVSLRAASQREGGCVFMDDDGRIHGLPQEREPPRGRLVLDLEDKKTTFSLSRALLQAGCLVGRMPRCYVNRDEVPLPKEVSRIHCLLIELDKHIHVFDLASTNGLTFEEFPIDHLKLPDRLPSTLALTHTVSMTWYPL